MAKVKFFCDSGANIHSSHEEVVDTVRDLGIEDWESLTDEEKYSAAEEWAWNAGLEIGYRTL